MNNQYIKLTKKHAIKTFWHSLSIACCCFYIVFTNYVLLEQKDYKFSKQKSSSTFTYLVMIRNLSKQSKQLLGQHCYITLILLIIKTLKRSVLRFYTKKTENMVEGVKGLKAKPTLGKKTAQKAKKSMKKIEKRRLDSF